jgi:hypothetical protein
MNFINKLIRINNYSYFLYLKLRRIFMIINNRLKKILDLKLVSLKVIIGD